MCGNSDKRTPQHKAPIEGVLVSPGVLGPLDSQLKVGLYGSCPRRLEKMPKHPLASILAFVFPI